jgi:DNA invertase Pin-like site-specific DNA recombinase
MTLVGYNRVSTADQHPEAQSDRLTAAGCERVFTDKGVSGMLARRPQWDKCLEYLRPGDVLVTIRLDRIGRSLRNLLEVMTDLGERGIDLKVLDQEVDTTTPSGRLIFAVLAAIAEFERDLIRDRTMDGLAAARARGRVGGRKRKLTDAQVQLARRLYDETGDDGKRAHTVQHIADMLKVDRTTVYRALERAEQQQDG